MQMTLKPEYYDLISCGIKTIEIRCNDEKRKKLKIGETISFRNLKTNEVLVVVVKEIVSYETFKELLKHYSFRQLGFENYSASEILKSLHQIYPRKEEQEFGVLAIKIGLCNNSTQ